MALICNNLRSKNAALPCAPYTGALMPAFWEGWLVSYPISVITCPSPFELGVVPVSPGILHTSVSSHHLHLLYQRSNLSPRNDCPNMVCSVGTEISWISAVQFFLSPHQATSISTPLAAPSPADAHDLAAHSIRLPDIPVDCQRYLSGYFFNQIWYSCPSLSI